MAHIPLKDQLKAFAKSKGATTSATFENGKTVEEVLKEQARLFVKILKEEISSLIYGRPESDWYDRSYDLLNSIDENLIIDPKTNTVKIGFIPDKAWHDSWFTKKGRKGYSRKAYVPMAVIEGYRVFGNDNAVIDGVDFMQAAVDRFEKEKERGVTIEVEGKDELYGNWWT